MDKSKVDTPLSPYTPTGNRSSLLRRHLLPPKVGSLTVIRTEVEISEDLVEIFIDLIVLLSFLNFSVSSNVLSLLKRPTNSEAHVM